MPRKTFWSFVAALLAVLSGLLLARVALKPIRYEVYGLNAYSSAEETGFVLLHATGLFAAAAGGVFLVILSVRWRTARARATAADRFGLRDVGILPVIVAASYLGSFFCFFTLDMSFTRVGGTTPLCYEDPFLQAYAPLWTLAARVGMKGGDRLLREDVVASRVPPAPATRFIAETWDPNARP